MRAMQYVGYGDPTQLRMADVPVPKPAPEELLVRVIASSVNPVDWKLYNGSLRYLVPMKFPGIPGFDIAGEVVEVGKQVEQFKAGDRVYASLDNKSAGLRPSAPASVPKRRLLSLRGWITSKPP